MARRFFLMAGLFLAAGLHCFGQVSLLRDYVGLINQSFHPDVVAYLGKFKTEFEKRGNTDAVKSIDAYLKGGSGTGFVYIGPDGTNYILTNYHVITQSFTLSVTFEKQDGTKTKYEGLTIIAADEDMDIALLGFPAGQKPFTASLPLLDRPPEEGEDVYSAGFPGLLGNVTPWQFGRGMVSNASVQFPADDDSDKMMGPYIQHTAQVDPGNSGGPLLVQTPGTLAGYSIAGINTLSVRWRQAANFSIPVSRVRAFLDSALKPEITDERAALDARVASFIEGVNVPRAVYEHIADYLSTACTAENAEYAVSEVLRSASRTVADAIVRAFNYSPVEGMNYAVAWTIENSMRSKQGSISASLDSVIRNVRGGFTVTFKVNNGTMRSEWTNEYGIWRISSFGDFAAGDKSFAEKKENERKEDAKLRTDYSLQLSAGYAYVFDLHSAVAVDLKIRSGYIGYGLKTIIGGKDFFQIETLTGFYIPIRLGKVGLTPYGDLGFGAMIRTLTPEEEEDSLALPLDFGISLSPGLMFTTAAVPGLYLQGAYQLNLYLAGLSNGKTYPHAFTISIGYGF